MGEMREQRMKMIIHTKLLVYTADRNHKHVKINVHVGVYTQ